jgi:delta8-fatty-acid desaturase
MLSKQSISLMSAAKDSWRRSNTAEKIISRQEIEAQIAEGRHIFIVDGKVLKVDAWLPYHPGGDKPIKHMVGRDATDEVNA